MTGEAPVVDEAIEQHIAAVKTVYEPLITGGGSRIQGGAKLWQQFTNAVESYRRNGRSAFVSVFERINELAVARMLLADTAHIGCPIQYEPKIAADDRRIDFVVPHAAASHRYVEVKTVHPTAEDSDENWVKTRERQARHPDNVRYIVSKDWMGASIYTDSFAARSKFMQYAREFESRLDDANKVQQGSGLLVCCGTGMAWHLSELEDFADFYRNGRHRADDPFGPMEAHALRNGKQLRRNIAAFGYLKRHMADVVSTEWKVGVRGPSWFQ